MREMLLRLDEIQPGKRVTKEVNLERETIETFAGEVVLDGIHARLCFRDDPLGYVVQYDVEAKAKMTCVRTGEPVCLDVTASDRISLRTEQPESAHVILAGSEMDVRFITDPNFDMRAFVLETIELELPAYPRIPEDQAADPPLPETQARDKESPFNVLSKLLDK